MQSHDYVPGVSGWKMHKGGEFELNATKITVGGLPATPQVITLTASEWPDSSFPVNAIEQLKFVSKELDAIPAEYRDSAELSTEDHSFDRDGSDIRTTLTYERLETEGEVAARIEKANVARTRIMFMGGALVFSRDGVPIVRLGDLSKTDPAQPFVVADDQVFLSEALIKNASVTKAKISDIWSIKMALRNGKYIAAGIGPGSQFLVDADRFAIKEPDEFEKALAAGDAAKFLDLLVGQIGKTELGTELKSPIADQVRDVIRTEIRPGGLLYRSK